MTAVSRSMDGWIHVQRNQSLWVARGKRGEVNSPLDVCDDSFHKIPYKVAIHLNERMACS